MKKVQPREEPTQSFAWICALTTLVSAVLLFLVQPIISKLILPWFGGSPAVWTTCMLFFQTLLLLGYAYAHWLVRAFNLPWQIRIHGFVTLAAAVTLPITPPTPSVDVEATPIFSILWLLGMNIGLPFFAISATGPLLQSWFGGVYPGRPPYRLYALSNIGSLAALWLFPLVLEPRLNSAQQDLVWSTGFGVYLVSLFVISLIHAKVPIDEDTIVYPKRQLAKEPISLRDLAAWIGLPALASAVLAAITSHICQDMAVVPAMYILPLSLYLVTFILAFDSPRWYIRPLWGAMAALGVLGVSVVMYNWTIQKYFNEQGYRFKLSHFTDRIEVEVLVYMIALFAIAMICHGETTRRKPPPGRLTLFYLMISVGGALGTGFVAILCPQIFTRYYELNILLVLGYLAGGAVLIAGITALADLNARYIAAGFACLALAAGFALVLTAQVNNAKDEADLHRRNFYGVASIKTEREGDSPLGDPIGRVLYNGAINHGFQFLEGPQRYQPNSYYALGSGVDVAFSLMRGRGEPLRVGVIGLGTGTLAAFGQEGDDFQFYEIDGKIKDIAENEFTYLSDTKATVRVNMGDARLFLDSQLQKEGSQKFDILVVDAFSGDAIPVHLITLESIHLYLEHVKPTGIIAFHTSNRHLNLAPVVTRLAKEIKAGAVLIEREENSNQGYDAASDWVLVAGDPALLNDPAMLGYGQRLDRSKKPEFTNAPLWTDSFSNVWEVMDPWDRPKWLPDSAVRMLLTLLCAVGISLTLTGMLWISSIAFRNNERVLGVLSLCCGVVAWAYGLMNYAQAKRPLMILMAGLGLDALAYWLTSTFWVK